MGSKQHLVKVEELSYLIEAIQGYFNNFSGALNEVEIADHQERLKKLQHAAQQLKDKVHAAPPVSVDPMPGFNKLCEKLRGYVTQEYVFVMRLMHKQFLSLQTTLGEKDDELKEMGRSLGLEEARSELEDVAQAFRRLGSKKLYEGDFDRVSQEIDQCESMRAKAEATFEQARLVIEDALPT